jgi:hypothetical protein
MSRDNIMRLQINQIGVPMFLKSLFSLLGLLIATATHATTLTNHHVFGTNKTVKAQSPGYCEIEIINRSMEDVIVSGGLNGSVNLRPFVIYSYELPHYISLSYYGYCYSGMFLHIDTTNGRTLYDRYTQVGSTLYVRSYQNTLKVESEKSNEKIANK